MKIKVAAAGICALFALMGADIDESFDLPQIYKDNRPRVDNCPKCKFCCFENNCMLHNHGIGFMCKKAYEDAVETAKKYTKYTWKDLKYPYVSRGFSREQAKERLKGFKPPCKTCRWDRKFPSYSKGSEALISAVEHAVMAGGFDPSWAKDPHLSGIMNIIQRESGGFTHSIGRAMEEGLGQQHPKYWGSAPVCPACQIQWCLKYAQVRYGSPAKAWTAWLKNQEARRKSNPRAGGRW